MLKWFKKLFSKKEIKSNLVQLIAAGGTIEKRSVKNKNKNRSRTIKEFGKIKNIR